MKIPGVSLGDQCGHEGPTLPQSQGETLLIGWRVPIRGMDRRRLSREPERWGV
jgi:hypothetical protein